MRRMVQNNVKKAFRIIGDLKTPLEFIGQTVDTFDYETGLPVLGATLTRTVEGVEIKVKRKDNTIVTKILLNYEDFKDIDEVVPNVYTRVKTPKGTYKLIEPATNNGYTLTLELSESVA